MKNKIFFFFQGISELKQPVNSVMSKLSRAAKGGGGGGGGGVEGFDIRKYIGGGALIKRVVSIMGDSPSFQDPRVLF